MRISFSLVLSVFLVVFGVGNAVRLATLPRVVAWVSGVSSAEDTSLLASERDYLSEQMLVFVLQGSARVNPDALDKFNSREIKHMDDVHRVYSGFVVWWLMSGLVVLGALLLRPKSIRLAINVLTKILLVATPVLGAVYLFWWEELFTGFHQMFFEEGTWLFYETDMLIRLFPERFWQLSFLVVLTTTVAQLIFSRVVAHRYQLSEDKNKQWG